ncbi:MULTISPECIES: chaplin [unclassified Streptomyces]|uniref:chaplin n=1 Tax=unclassified Streptomyces TaxID=2593676 RepID=UPI003253531A
MSRIVRMTVLSAIAAATVLGGASVASADSGAEGAAIGSPGVLSGNVVQVPVDLSVNACGNSIDVIGLLNPAFGNVCVNGGGRDHGRDHGGWNHGGWDHGRDHGRDHHWN